MSKYRPTVGARIEWEEAHDYHRGTCLVRSGTVTAIAGRNVWIDDSAKWLPSMTNLREIEPAPSSAQDRSRQTGESRRKGLERRRKEDAG